MHKLKHGFLFLLLASLPLAAAEAWPTYHGDASLQGLSAVKLPEAPVELWRYQTEGSIPQPPVSDGERIFLASTKGIVTALDLKGKKLWSRTLTRTDPQGVPAPERFEAPLACFSGLVLAGSRDGTLYALAAATGADKWQYKVGGTIQGTPNAAPSALLVINQAEGAVAALEPATGKRLWQSDGVQRCDGSAAVADGRIVFGSCAAALHVLSAKDGKRLRNVELGDDSQIAGGVALHGNLVFAGTRSGAIVCVNVDTGAIVWKNQSQTSQAFATPALAETLVIGACDTGAVFALERATGKPVWTFAAGGAPSSPVIAADKVAVVSDGTLFLLDLAKGTKCWSKKISDEVSSPAIIANMILVGADDGILTAYGNQAPGTGH
jgi:outer membrane protein assembly factor BamB